jgi:hypothetical protein
MGRKQHYSQIVGLCLLLLAVTAIKAQTTVTTSGGTANSIPLYSGSFTLSNSVLTQYSGNIGLGTTTPTQPLTIINDGLAPIYGGLDTTTANGLINLGKVPFIEIVGNNDGNHPPAIGLVRTNLGNSNAYQDPAELYLGGTRAVSASTVGTGPVGNADILGRIGFFGDDGSSLRTRAAIIDAEVYTANAAVSAQSVPAALNLATSGSAPIIFYTNTGPGWSWGQLVGSPSERMRVDYNGNVGIGTTTPGSKLEVNGNLKLTAGSGASITFPDGTVQSTAFISGSSGITQTNGNIGIGTTSPVAPLDINGFLHVSGNTNPTTTAQGGYLSWNALTGGAGETDFINNPGGGSGGFAFMNTPPSGSPRTNLMFLTGAGSLGIGTISPRTNLDVSGGAVNSDGLISKISAENADVDLVLGEKTSDGSNAGVIQVYSQGVGGNLGPTHYSLSIQPSGGNVGVGTTAPGAKLEVNGSVKLTSGSGASITFADGTVQSTAYTGVTCGGDYAESVDVSGDRKQYQPGDVLVLTSEGQGDIARSLEAYSTMVAGIYSTKPGIVGRRQTSDPKATTTEIPMAMVGIVPTKVSAENGPIRRGDLLVTSSTTGYAMKGTDRERMLGAVIGKAMGNLDSGTGVIEVLVTLQ